MPEDSKNLKDFAERFMQKNPKILRDIMDSHYIEFENLRFSQGKCIGGEVKKMQYKKRGD